METYDEHMAESARAREVILAEANHVERWNDGKFMVVIRRKGEPSSSFVQAPDDHPLVLAFKAGEKAANTARSLQDMIVEMRNRVRAINNGRGSVSMTVYDVNAVAVAYFGPKTVLAASRETPAAALAALDGKIAAARTEDEMLAATFGITL